MMLYSHNIPSTIIGVQFFQPGDLTARSWSFLRTLLRFLVNITQLGGIIWLRYGPKSQTLIKKAKLQTVTSNI